MFSLNHAEMVSFIRSWLFSIQTTNMYFFGTKNSIRRGSVGKEVLNCRYFTWNLWSSGEEDHVCSQFMPKYVNRKLWNVVRFSCSDSFEAFSSVAHFFIFLSCSRQVQSWDQAAIQIRTWSNYSSVLMISWWDAEKDLLCPWTPVLWEMHT